jgi:signal transduction histidine kinase/CheY-like chemotaxis protein
MVSLRRLALSVLLLLSPLPAQQQRASALEQQLATVTPQSLAWFELQFERVEALVDVDLQQATIAITSLWHAAQTVALPGVAATAASLAAFVVARHEGPVAALPWRERAGQAAPEWPAPLRAYHHLASARVLCLAGEHVAELEASIPGQAAAQEDGDPVLQLRAALATLHATTQRGVTGLRRQFDAAMAGPAAAAVASLEPWVRLEEWLAQEDRTSAAAADLLASIERQAIQQGNLRLEAVVHSLRGTLALARNDFVAAIPHQREAMRCFDRLGDRRDSAATRDITAWTELRLGNFDAAQACVDAAEAMLSGRGLSDVEREVLQTRLQLAVAKRDGDAAAALAAEIEASRRNDADHDRQLATARARLEEAEAQRERAEAALRDEQQEAAAQAASQQLRQGSLLLVGCLVLCAALWWSRRRVVVSHRRLADQIRRADAADARKQELERRMRELERSESLVTLTAGVAHDFNNLLTSILGNAELLRMRGVPASERELLDTIVTAGQQAGRLCRQLQIYSGGEPLHHEALDLVGVVRDMLPVLQAAARRVATVRCEVPLQVVGVRADRGQLEQILLNLVVNANDAGAQEVVIVVAPGRAGGATGDRAALVVRDDGHGMTEAVRQRIFDPFFTTRFPGRGLGLAVVYGAVRSHGGTIAVDSEPGRGTTFTIQLPTAALDPVVPEPVVVLPSMAPPAGGRVFVVDDEPLVGALLVRMLASLGRTAVAFADGQELLRQLALVPAAAPVTVFVDLTMPDLDGLEVARRIRSQRPNARVVLMSGHTADHLEQVGEALRPDAVLAKPFRLDVLRRVLEVATTTSAEV